MERKAYGLTGKNIFLIGFMGSGKTTVASYLGKAYQMKTTEMDGAISEQEGMSIPDIFALHGEEYFRRLETAFLIELRQEKGVVVSCGGGVPMRSENVAEMKKNGRVILLEASPETIYERVKDSNDRPLLEGNKNIAYIAELICKRKEKYEAAADIVIETDGKKVSVIGEEIMRKVLELEQEKKEHEVRGKEN